MLMQAVQTLQMQSHVQAVTLLISVTVAAGRKLNMEVKWYLPKKKTEFWNRFANTECSPTWGH